VTGQDSARDGKRWSGAAIAAMSLVLLGALVLSGVAAVAFGAVSIPIPRVFGIVADALGWPFGPANWSRAERNIVWELRLPRIILGGVAGAGLAVVGAD
jgi:iron complex transport system permease protein